MHNYSHGHGRHGHKVGQDGVNIAGCQSQRRPRDSGGAQSSHRRYRTVVWVPRGYCSASNAPHTPQPTPRPATRPTSLAAKPTRQVERVDGDAAAGGGDHLKEHTERDHCSGPHLSLELRRAAGDRLLRRLSWLPSAAAQQRLVSAARNEDTHRWWWHRAASRAARSTLRRPHSAPIRGDASFGHRALPHCAPRS